MRYFKPADEADFLECVDLARTQLAAELCLPADQLEERRIYERAGAIYNRTGGAWVPNDSPRRFDHV